MSLISILKKKLSPEGCRWVGEELGRRVEALTLERAEQGLPPLAPEVLDVVTKVRDKATRTTGSGVSVRRMDNGADRFLGGYYGSFHQRERCFTHEDILPLTEKEQAHLALLQKTRQTIFPYGIEFITKSVTEQHDRLLDIQRLFQNNPALLVTLKELGLERETERFLRWITRYSQAMGAQKPSVEDAARLGEFHAAWEELLIEVRQKYKGEEGRAVRERLLSPFDEQLTREAESERRARLRREEQAEEGSPSEN